MEFQSGDRIRRRTWPPKRFATVISESENGELCARFKRQGKYFWAWSKDFEHFDNEVERAESSSSR